MNGGKVRGASVNCSEGEGAFVNGGEVRAPL